MLFRLNPLGEYRFDAGDLFLMTDHLTQEEARALALSLSGVVQLLLEQAGQPKAAKALDKIYEEMHNEF